MPTDLQSRALAFVIQLGPDRAREHKLRTIKEIRDSITAQGDPTPSIPEVAAALEWALAQPRDFSAHLADWQNTPSYWRQYRFPHGRAVNVEVDPRIDASAFRFVIEYDGEDGMFTATGLTTAEVEAKLADVAALPALDNQHA